MAGQKGVHARLRRARPVHPRLCLPQPRHRDEHLMKVLRTQERSATRMSITASTLVSHLIAAPREAVYRALLDQDAVATWLPPTPMTGVVHAFDAHEGGAF